MAYRRKPRRLAELGATKKRAADESAPVPEVVGTDQGEGGHDKPGGTKTTEKQIATIEQGREIYSAGFNRDRENQDEAYIDLKMLAGEDHWDGTALKQRQDDDRPALVVNQMPQFVRQVTGDMRQMRPSIKVVPVTDDASKDVAAKILPGLVRYIETRSDASGIYFAAADQQVSVGIGHWMVTHEYSAAHTFNQEIRIAPVPDGIAVVWDADAVLPTREDASDCFVPYDMSRREFERKYPGKSADSFESSSQVWSNWVSDEHVRVAIWYHKVPEKKRLAFFDHGRIDDVTGDEDGERVAVLLGAEIREKEGVCVYRTVISANELLEPWEKVPGPNIPVVPLIGEELVVGRRIVRRGVIRVLRDVQRIYNYAISTQTEILALQPKAPFIGTRAQFEKYADQWETANSKNWPYLEYDAQPNVPPPQRAQPPVASSGLEELMVKTTEAMYATTGIYPAALGAKSNETSGRAIMARQREGDTGTYVYHDNFARALRRTGQIIVDMVPEIYDTSRSIAITGEDGKIDKLDINKQELDKDAQTHISINDVTKGAYLVAVEMGPSYSTKREESREGMLELIRTVGPEGAVMFLDLFIKAMDWPLADKISERAKELLPPQIRANEAAEAGEPPPPPPPPPPPTPEQQKAMELEAKKLHEQIQANLELARKNEIADRQASLEAEKLELERQQLPTVAKLEEQLRAEQAKAAELASQITTKSIQHELETGTLQFKILELQTELGQAPEKTAEQLHEEMQKNIELARANEIADREQQYRFRELDHKARALTHGQHADAQAAAAAQAEQMQGNIEKARENELKERQHGFALKELDQKERQSLREHELAMNPPPAPATSAANIDAEQEQEIDDLKGHVAALTNELMETREMLMVLAQEAVGPDQPDVNAADGLQVPGAAPVPEKPDPMAAIADAMSRIASRNRPTGVKRTSDGMQVVYGDEPAKPPLATPDEEPVA